MIVYRLERQGIGPFMGRSHGIGTTSRKKHIRSRHAMNQAKLKSFYTEHQRAIRNGEYLFGTDSKELLKAYFSYNLKPLFKQGYRIKTYKVPDSKVMHMGTEVAFPIKYHKLKHRDAVEERMKEQGLILRR